MTNLTKRFILVDDDPLTNSLTKKIIERNLGEVDVKDFDIPELALEYIENEFRNGQYTEKTVLFLDINMPTLTGWEFLDRYETFATPLKDQFNIYILSSSIDPADVQRAKLNPLVIDFIEKPIKIDFLVKTFLS